MKRKDNAPRKQVFVFTPGEWRAAGGILAAFLLGLATMHYRAKHPRPPLPPTAKEKRAAKEAAARAKSHRASRTPVPPTSPPVEEPTRE